MDIQASDERSTDLCHRRHDGEAAADSDTHMDSTDVLAVTHCLLHALFDDFVFFDADGRNIFFSYDNQATGKTFRTKKKKAYRLFREAHRLVEALGYSQKKFYRYV